MLDFKELPVDGNDFELLIRELLFKMGFRVYWSGKGADGGRDLICIEESKSAFMSTEKRWLIQCKHTAHSEKSIGIKDLDDILGSCAQHKAKGYLLVCSTYPSSGVVNRLEGISSSTEGFSATYWDSITIERLLKTPYTWPIAQRFFPKSSNNEGWQVYATERPNHWLINFEGYYFHLSNRIQSIVDMHLDSIRDRIREMESIIVPDKHLLRLRAAYYDDKNGNYQWYIDYLYPYDENPVVNQYSIKRELGDGYVLGDGQVHYFDVHSYQYNGLSDHYDPDHYKFYDPYLRDFLDGSNRSPQYSMKLPGGEDIFITEGKEEELFRDEKFNQLVECFRKIDFIKVIRAKNSSIENIDKFQYQFNWNEVIRELDIDTDLFFSARISFTCNDSKRLISMVKCFPYGAEAHFKLSSRYSIDFEGNDEEQIYDLVFSIHPEKMRNKVVARKSFNKYFKNILNGIKLFKEEG
ncbi:restriction endonuclease [Priestia aryabhattai]|uniref:restriction endonuclease n=1 Tax=Priestia aryabhattai TaxID=412384 RepID=UPI001EC70202|nr:restriction endonuclease [Priestia aryabhattai]MBY0091425.1 restriction endonuclease [Priestia aryabhattai]MBY0102320.1 restriction endonuclease [Priestia aryabhattai]